MLISIIKMLDIYLYKHYIIKYHVSNKMIHTQWTIYLIITRFISSCTAIPYFHKTTQQSAKYTKKVKELWNSVCKKYLACMSIRNKVVMPVVKWDSIRVCKRFATSVHNKVGNMCLLFCLVNSIQLLTVSRATVDLSERLANCYPRPQSTVYY